ncbi:WhiB family transcriptional regulator [Streptomonospora wellingtoniae]|uniref:Transcriptional regulator WhiB n=1 Tax=Streptomonospora wellingtoniae TaxID=3075544 RepID=A0ABU2KUH2_9ACTN|nr:WhiB family transcriptional regulator [Streptomonospora sp. DSM 45055]MDT0302950.1 WhiB family transcriptional regulator [Streptomonospora sp. DSM 45055]
MTGYRAHEPGTANLAARSRWDWAQHAACQGESLELFFGPDGERLPQREVREEKAKAICQQQCPVRTECLEYAIAKPEKYGTWAGLNEDERASLRRSRMRRGELASRPQTCAYGHPRTEANTRTDKHGYRRCLPCYQQGSRRTGHRGAAA